ncbi:FecR domain-containing protein [Sphingobium sp. BYY-5]|uniref:FecR family protein n=1 Tax=Sphingobium sp. BYY-5 TaxID=2926400 RepID=UPI001FA71F9E|nr:FecR domain-containing protein [Sphingobium sp. BYY-5]MCI4592330.1 FecR domain-containing protein [Sphingobium sp. BYY-5]
MSKPFDARALEQIDSPQATAAAYFSHFRSPNATAEDYVAFEHWHARDEAHRSAWARIEREWEEAGKMRTDARILAIREQAIANRRPRRRWRRPLATAAALGALLIGGSVIWHRHTNAPAAFVQAEGRTISTGIGQQASFRMADGSTITVNTGSTLSVSESDTRRSSFLKQGEAFFEVAKNPRKPFVVEVEGVTVTALGTAFAVRDLGDGGVRVTLAHGRVRVDMPAASGKPAQSAILSPQTELLWQAGRFRTTSVDVDRQLGWRQGMIAFDHMPLDQAVAEINRYSPQEIIIASPALAHYPISGSFRIGVTRGFLQSLELSGIARVTNESATRAELVTP